MKINMKDELVNGSITLLIMLGVFNVLNYVFQMSMAKMLGPLDYGVLAALMSIVYIFGIPSEAIQTVLAKYTSRFRVKNENGKIKDLLLKSLKKAARFSLIFFLLFLILSVFLSSLLKINYFLLALTGLLIFYSFIIPINRGILQGSKKFRELGWNMILESAIKVIASIGLVFVGLRVSGAMGAVLAAGIIAFFFSFFSIKEVLKSKKKKESFKGIYRYSLPSLIAITSIVLMYSMDIIIARVYFSAELAGQYAFISLIGKTIIFANTAIGKAMFPLTSEKFEKGHETSSLFKKSLILISIISAAALILFITMPELLVKILSLGSSKYLAAANVLFIVGLAFTFTSFSNIIVLYKLSIGKMKKSSILLLAFALLEIIMLCIFHSDIVSFSISLAIANFLLLLYSVFLAFRK